MFIKSLIPTELNSTWKVVATCESQTECQVDDFLSSLPTNYEKDGVAIRRLFAYVALNGPRLLPPEICHTIATDIWQFRKGHIRVVWFYDEGKIVACCHAFVKKTQKTPLAVIRHATEALRDYRLQKARSNVTELPGG
ncbi:type II toxin-antitoxin system RelE/ParE family toxin [Trichlorobacter lovleyi]|uniref:Type II toxin-antitoxin system RelE/ParE family toxin n=1 Tax=Trichlorobacter lovleyi (strain ATCC BAA-1151 / DSM 17278 / SZ) TaxID=398767 RepID=B3E292_TRIL1|nr:type II toxin-antitoxin system RelE/ParE family toxin [Trichlorobacter lovleyi]ACD97195.1 protein of unknown function DUF891 [Trichlorobacter lovleyi SZ]